MPVLQQRLQRHAGLVELRGTPASVHELLAHVLDAHVAHPVAHEVVVHARAQGAEEVDGLPREGVDQAEGRSGERGSGGGGWGGIGARRQEQEGARVRRGAEEKKLGS